jgi:hypothetical protein
MRKHRLNCFAACPEKISAFLKNNSAASVFFLAPEFPRRYAARAKGEGESRSGL